MATEIASAYLALYAKMPGVQNDIATQLGAVDADKVGQDLGKQTGAGYTKGFALAGAVGGLVATLAASAGQALGDLVGDAVAASDATSKFAKTLEFTGIDTSTIDNLKKSTKQYADDTVYDLATVQNTTAQLAANGVKDYDKLTEAAGNLNAVAGGNQETFSSVSMMLTQTAGAGKLTTENWNQLADAIPGASGVMQEALLKAGAYTGNFRDAMEKGEITADEFNAALMELGTQPVAVEAAKSTETMEGALGGLQATIVGGLADAITAIKPMLTDFINGMSSFVSFIIDNIDWIGPLAAGIAIVATAVGLWSAAQWVLNVAMTANPIGIIIVAIGLLIGAIILLVTNWDTVVAFLGDVWQGFVDWFMAVMDGFLGWWNGLWTAVWEWIVSVWDAIVAGITTYINLVLAVITAVAGFIVSVWTAVWDGISSFFTSIWNFMVAAATVAIKMVLSIITTVVNTVSSVWNSVWSGISSFFSGIWEGIVNTVNTVGAVFGAAFSNVAKIVSGAFEGVVSVIRGVINSIIDVVNGALSGINDVASTVGGALGLDIHVGQIPRLAQGALIQKRPGGIIANIGEGRYDEAVVPLSPKILDALSGGSGSGKAVTIHNTIMLAPGEDPRVAGRQFGRSFQEQIAGVV